VLGESGDIIFPKLDEERDMISFDSIAHDLLKFVGFVLTYALRRMKPGRRQCG
jgi:hypothetical protein